MTRAQEYAFDSLTVWRPTAAGVLPFLQRHGFVELGDLETVELLITASRGASRRSQIIRRLPTFVRYVEQWEQQAAGTTAIRLARTLQTGPDTTERLEVLFRCLDFSPHCTGVQEMLVMWGPDRRPERRRWAAGFDLADHFNYSGSTDIESLPEMHERAVPGKVHLVLSLRTGAENELMLIGAPFASTSP